jgi:hypothetical protein
MTETQFIDLFVRWKQSRNEAGNLVAVRRHFIAQVLWRNSLYSQFGLRLSLHMEGCVNI